MDSSSLQGRTANANNAPTLGNTRPLNIFGWHQHGSSMRLWKKEVVVFQSVRQIALSNEGSRNHFWWHDLIIGDPFFDPVWCFLRKMSTLESRRRAKELGPGKNREVDEAEGKRKGEPESTQVQTDQIANSKNNKKQQQQQHHHHHRHHPHPHPHPHPRRQYKGEQDKMRKALRRARGRRRRKRRKKQNTKTRSKQPSKQAGKQASKQASAIAMQAQAKAQVLAELSHSYWIQYTSCLSWPAGRATRHWFLSKNRVQRL